MSRDIEFFCAPDPFDPATFWLYGEWLDSRGESRWATIAQHFVDKLSQSRRHRMAFDLQLPVTMHLAERHVIIGLPKDADLASPPQIG